MTLRPVDPIGVYNRWDWFRAGIQRAIDRTAAHMRPEDVYLRVRTGTAWAYVIEADGEDIGFLILTQEHDPDGLVLFVWGMWAIGAHKHRVAIREELEQLAKGLNAKRIRWWSPRKGWADFGQAVATIYEREI